MPPGQFILFDMERDGSGQWRNWRSQWKLPFIWTSLHVFGGNQGIKGNLSLINEIPFDGPTGGYSNDVSSRDGQQDAGETRAVGVGYTPEGLDQNPAYYELLQEAAFRGAPVPNVTAWLVQRAQRRYGFRDGTAISHVAAAWAAIGSSGYAHDGQVHDGTAVGLVSGEPKSEPWNGFELNGHTPKPALCAEWRAWGDLLAAAAAEDVSAPMSSVLPSTFSYDVVDIGREVLSQLTLPIAQNFSAAIKSNRLNKAKVNATGGAYAALLRDLDTLLATDEAFLLGTWLASARKLGLNATDCVDTQLRGPRAPIISCADFMEWNARAQLTTWYPTLSPGQATPGQQGGKCNDYARKHWAGLVGGYYAARVDEYVAQALEDSNAGRAFSQPALNRRVAKLSYNWQTDFGNIGLTNPAGDPVNVSLQLRTKYSRFFTACS